ncbi:hypothetical protein LJC25_03885 [Bacteroidales bacterium OttesenSCG-928-K03]|nr:hypothetical protein [Bacteroidales bacterium OttesenSCG-928-K22]MDL2242849.1 hypothetical protein [Bacteroidales bacterium OttesenSCG-928-K03]
MYTKSIWKRWKNKLFSSNSAIVLLLVYLLMRDGGGDSFYTSPEFCLITAFGFVIIISFISVLFPSKKERKELEN